MIMARLPDEQWMMIEDSIEKKNIARSSRYRRTHCGKSGGMKTPSDYMSRKEKIAMNSEVRSYNLNKSMSWNEFSKLPEDLKIEYIKNLRSKFNVPYAEIAKFMHVSRSHLCKKLKVLGLGLGKGEGGKSKMWYKTDKANEFYRWLEEGKSMSVEDIECKVIEPIVEPKLDICEEKHEEDTEDKYTTATERLRASYVRYTPTTKATPETGNLSFNCKANEALAMLADILGEKMVDLQVAWNVLEGD